MAQQLRLSNPLWLSFLLVLSIFSAVVSTEIYQRNVRGRRTSILSSSLSSSRVAALPVAATTVTMNTVSIGVAKPPVASTVASAVKIAAVVPGKAPAAAPVASIPGASTVKIAAVATVKAPTAAPVAVAAKSVLVSAPIKATAAIPVSVSAPVKVAVACNVTAKANVTDSPPGKAPVGITAPVKVSANVSTSTLAKSPVAAPVAIFKATIPVAVTAPVKTAAPVKPVAGAVAAKMPVAPIAAPVASPPVSTWSGTVRVDAGGADKDWTDPENQYQWKTDRYFDPKTSTTESIKPCGTLSPLLCTYRIGSEIHYDIPVPNPDSIYRIVLTIMEPTLNYPGQRPLDISSGPKTYYSALDPHTACGGKQKSCTLQIKTGATDGKLDVKIVGTNPKNKAVLMGFLVQEVKK